MAEPVNIDITGEETQAATLKEWHAPDVTISRVVDVTRSSTTLSGAYDALPLPNNGVYAS